MANLPLQFSNSTDGDGIIETIDDYCDTDSTSYPTKKKTRDVNFALVNFYTIADKAAGKRQVDDPNHADAPEIVTDIVSGQKDYSFTVDENSNQILTIYKVRIKDANGVWRTLKQKDLYSDNDEWLNTTQTGTPSEYDITEDRVIFNLIPDYNSTGGLEFYISRTPAYYVSTDTTKTSAIPHQFQEYLVLRPSYLYCVKKGLQQASLYRVALYGVDGRGGMEKAIKEYYTNRNKDDRLQLTPEPINSI